MDEIPVFPEQVPPPLPVPKTIDELLEERYYDELEYIDQKLESLKRRKIELLEDGKEKFGTKERAIFEEVYQKLLSEFKTALQNGEKRFRCVLAKVTSSPVSRSNIRHVRLEGYKLYAVERFAYELTLKKYKVKYGEEVDYRESNDPDDYHDDCTCRYVVSCKLC